MSVQITCVCSGHKTLDRRWVFLWENPLGQGHLHYQKKKSHFIKGYAARFLKIGALLVYISDL